MRRGVLLAPVLALTLTAAAAGQGRGGGVPALPSGVPAVLLPVQSAAPLPSGAWPAGAASREDLLERVDAELEFAFAEEGADASAWHTPAEVEERAARNPSLGVEPGQLAVEVLAGRGRGERVPAPLHGQLRKLGALFGARYLMLPLGLGWTAAGTGPEGADPDSTPPDTAGGPGGPDRRTTGRAALELALVDIRSGEVMWRGTLHGRPAPRDSRALLATLAERLVEGVAP